MLRSLLVFSTPPRTVTTLMLWVLVACLPALSLMVMSFGLIPLRNLLLATMTALLCEALAFRLRKKPVLPALRDSSVIVTAWLLVLSLPPLAPAWLGILGTAFAVLIAKHCYGGLGHNLFNPAMVGYVVLLIAFPQAMTTWPLPSVDAVRIRHTVSSPVLPDVSAMDAITGATPLDNFKTSAILPHPPSDIDLWWQWLAGAWWIGGILLLARRIITWHIPGALLMTLFLMTGIHKLLQPEALLPPWEQLLYGAAIFGAFFIATDPVTSPSTAKGKLLFGTGIGTLIYLIRVFGGYPDGVAFAVLLMNLCVPFLDEYTRPRVYGH